MGHFYPSCACLVYCLYKSTYFHVKQTYCRIVILNFLLLFSHDSCDRCAIPDEYLDEYKLGLKVEGGEEKKEEDDKNLEVSDKDADGMNDDKEEESSNKNKEVMPNRRRPCRSPRSSRSYQRSW